MTHATPMVAAEVPRPARTLVLGCGSIGQAVVPLLIRDLGFDPRSIRVVEMADTHRYRMCGNGVVSNVAHWIGARYVASKQAAGESVGSW